MKAHHQGRRALCERQASAQGLRCRAQHSKAALGDLAQIRTFVEGEPRFEHRRVIGRLVTGEGEISPADIFESSEGVRTAVVPGAVEMRSKQLEPAPRDVGDQRVAVTEMAIGGGGADPGPARGIGKGKPCRALFCNQVEGGLDQRLAQIAVVISAPPARPLFRPPHVNIVYIKTEAGGRNVSQAGRIDGASYSRYL